MTRLNRAHMAQYVCSYIASVTGLNVTDVLPSSIVELSELVSEYISSIPPYQMDIIFSVAEPVEQPQRSFDKRHQLRHLCDLNPVLISLGKTFKLELD